MLGLAAPAWSCYALASGTVNCTTGAVQWTITNGPQGGPMTTQWALAEGDAVYTVTGYANPLGNSATTTALTTVPPDASNLLTLRMGVFWPVDNFSSVVTATVDLGTICGRPTTSTSTTTTTTPTSASGPTSSTSTSTSTSSSTSTPTTYPCQCSTSTTDTSTTYVTTTTYDNHPVCYSVSAVSANGAAVVSWAVTRGPVTDYVVTPYLGTRALAPRVVSASHKSGVIRGLANGKTYRFTVAVRDPHGTGPLSSPTNAVTVGAPTAPIRVRAAAFAGKALVHWSAPASDSGSRIVAYVVTPYRNGVAQPARVFKNRATAEMIKGLRPGKVYTFRVVARNARGQGLVSVVSNAVRPV